MVTMKKLTGKYSSRLFHLISIKNMSENQNSWIIILTLQYMILCGSNCKETRILFIGEGEGFFMTVGGQKRLSCSKDPSSLYVTLSSMSMSTSKSQQHIKTIVLTQICLWEFLKTIDPLSNSEFQIPKFKRKLRP